MWPKGLLDIHNLQGRVRRKDGVIAVVDGRILRKTSISGAAAEEEQTRQYDPFVVGWLTRAAAFTAG